MIPYDQLCSALERYNARRAEDRVNDASVGATTPENAPVAAQPFVDDPYAANADMSSDSIAVDDSMVADAVADADAVASAPEWAAVSLSDEVAIVDDEDKSRD